MRASEAVGGNTSCDDVCLLAGTLISDNNLVQQSGWGVYVAHVSASTVSGNQLINSIRSCPQAPDGCESAGFLAIDMHSCTVAENFCFYSGDCYYMNGENFPSNGNTLTGNTCSGAYARGRCEMVCQLLGSMSGGAICRDVCLSPLCGFVPRAARTAAQCVACALTAQLLWGTGCPHNCYEITFSSGNCMDGDVSLKAADGIHLCYYPFWIGGSNIGFTHSA